MKYRQYLHLRTWTDSGVALHLIHVILRDKEKKMLPARRFAARFSSSAATASATTTTTRTYGGLKDEDRIFTNLYQDGDFGLKGARARGDWVPLDS